MIDSYDDSDQAVTDMPRTCVVLREQGEYKCEGCRSSYGTVRDVGIIKGFPARTWK